jgi:Leucine-rich repeat (LRR) protein
VEEESPEYATYQPLELHTHFSVKYLLKLEQRIIASMFESENDYENIRSQCYEDDFTFSDHQILFKYLTMCDYDDIRNIRASENVKTVLMSIFEEVSSSVCIETMIKAIESDISEDLECDIVELLIYSNEKTIALLPLEEGEDIRKIYIKIVQKEGDFTALYQRDRLCKIWMSSYKGFPTEYCDTYMETFENLVPLLQDIQNNPSSLIPGENSPFDSMWVIINKDIRSIEAIERLIQWADENVIDESLFPRSKELLSSHSMVELENLALKNIPAELLSLFLVSLNIKNNQITELPEGHWHKYYFWSLIACNNNMSTLPKTFFEAKRIKFLCLHGNRFESFPEEFGNFTELLTLSLSNNPIRTLPDTLRNLSELKTLDLENTSIDTLPEWIFEFANLYKFSCDDKHLPFLLENPEFIKQFNTINLFHSKYAIDHDLIRSCGLEIEYEDWIDPNDIQDHGCIMLKRAAEEIE